MAESQRNKPAHNRKDITGNRYGRLTVVGFDSFKSAGAYWLCRCDCGNEKAVRGPSLKSGLIVSCGCKRSRTHDKSYTPEYRTWVGILARCTDKNNSLYQFYGAVGIYLSARWRSFENFYTDIGPKPSRQHSIDRIDGNGPYAFWNCRWATPSQQQRNRRDNVMVMYHGKRVTLADAVDATGLSYSTVSQRARKGLTEETGLFAPPNPRLQRKRFKVTP